MRLTMSDRKAVIKAWSSQYRKTSKKGKGQILDELVALTGYNCWYVAGLLRWDGKVSYRSHAPALCRSCGTGRRVSTEPFQRGAWER